MTGLILLALILPFAHGGEHAARRRRTAARRSSATSSKRASARRPSGSARFRPSASGSRSGRSWPPAGPRLWSKRSALRAAPPRMGSSLTGGIGMVDGAASCSSSLLVAILYAQGEIAARGVLAFGYRIGGERGWRSCGSPRQAVRSVALGVVVTALVQSVLAGLGLWICGVPQPACWPQSSSCSVSRNSVRCWCCCLPSPGSTGPISRLGNGAAGARGSHRDARQRPAAHPHPPRRRAADAADHRRCHRRVGRLRRDRACSSGRSFSRPPTRWPSPGSRRTAARRRGREPP